MEYSEKIRDLANKSPQFIEPIINNGKLWNQLCSSMDVLGDTEQGIYEFEQGENCGYIEVYGLLQALFLQQDAVRYIAKTIGVEISNIEALLRIRNIRNDSIGHPMNRGNGSSFHYISRCTISKSGFTMSSYAAADDTDKFIDIDLSEILREQKAGVQTQLAEIYRYMADLENSHREKHRENIIEDIFHPSMKYLVSKIYLSFSPNGDRYFGGSHLKMVREMVDKFKQALQERNEFDSNYTAVDLVAKFEYAADRIDALWTKECITSERTIEGDIYCEYLERRLFDLKKISAEVDEKYATDID